MQNLPIVHMLEPQAYLSEPVKNEALAKEAAALLLYHFLQVTSICIVHDDAKLAFLGLVNLAESDYIGVVECLKNFRFFQRVITLIFTHFPDIHLLNDCHFF